MYILGAGKQPTIKGDLVNRKELVTAVADGADLEQKTVDSVLRSLQSTLEDAAAKGEKVSVPGFFTLAVGDRAARRLEADDVDDGSVRVVRRAGVAERERLVELGRGLRGDGVLRAQHEPADALEAAGQELVAEGGVEHLLQDHGGVSSRHAGTAGDFTLRVGRGHASGPCSQRSSGSLELEPSYRCTNDTTSATSVFGRRPSTTSYGSPSIPGWW